MYIIYKTHNPMNTNNQIQEYVASTHYKHLAIKYCEEQNKLPQDPYVVFGYRTSKYLFVEDDWYGVK